MTLTQKFKSSTAILMTSLAGLFASTKDAGAAIVTPVSPAYLVEGSGNIISVSSAALVDENNDGVIDFQVGDSFSFSFLLDATAEDAWPSSPDVSLYQSLISDHKITLNGRKFDLATGDFVVDTNFDRMYFTTTDNDFGSEPSPQLNGKRFDFIQYYFDSDTFDLQQSSIAGALSEVSELDGRYTMAFRNATTQGSINQISVTAVPEPGAIGLFAGGLALAAAGMHRMRRRNESAGNNAKGPSEP